MAGSEPSGEMRSRMAFIALLFTIFSTGSCSSQVPLVLWSSNGYTLPPLASLSAGHVMSSDQLVSYLNSALGSGPHNVLLFLQEKLSKDDFTMYGGVFGNKQDSAFPNLEAALHSSSSQLVVPALSWPGSIAVPALLQEKLGVLPLHVDPATLASVHLNPSDNNLLVFNLPYPTGSHMSCKDVLSNNDEVIGEVLSVMKAQDVPYIAIYTGLRPSRVIEEMSMVGQSMGRSLLQESLETETVKPPLMFNNSEGNPCIMLWAQTLNISFSMLPWFDLGPLTFNSSAIVSTDESTCTANSSRLVLNYGSSVPGYSTLVLTFAMSQRFYPVSGRHWFTLDTVELQFNNETAIFNGSRGIYAPTNYSFHCQSVNSFRYPLLVNRAPTTTTNISLWRLNFIDFQIQGFGIVNGTNFSYANDCAGFFTPGIWMGLITSLIMLLILTYGLHMIMQVRTMDRFDDPKGPSISVPQSE